MHDYTALQKILEEQQVGERAQGLVRDFLLSLPFLERQMLMGVFLGFPEKIGLFIEMLERKTEFAKNPTEEKAQEILDLECGEIKNLMAGVAQ